MDVGNTEQEVRHRCCEDSITAQGKAGHTLAAGGAGCAFKMLSSMSMSVCTAALPSSGMAPVASARTALAAGGLPSSGCASCLSALRP